MGEVRSARAALVAAAVALDGAGLNAGSAGNLSVRVGDHLLVTPSGIPAPRMDERDLVLLDPGGAVVDGDRVPTSEWQLHAAVLRARPEVGAVVHTHSPEATAAAVVGRPVPAVHYAIARMGAAAVPVAPYATYGTAALADAVVQAMGSRGTACLMANHGAVVVAGDLDGAVALAVDLEWLCRVHRLAVQQGSPTILPAEEVAHVAERFLGYGQQRR